VGFYTGYVPFGSTIACGTGGMSDVGTPATAPSAGIDLSLTAGCFRVALINHEAGHAMGFSHHDSVGALGVQLGSDQPVSELERYHANIMYSRPKGNHDVDEDSATTASPYAVERFRTILSRPVGERSPVACVPWLGAR
jgi:hypothetical protein